ncbi:hypothetical protein PoB_000653300 [Plakobranchus ocellatus]|uniref:Uncharacterized protein n=1 Tax=Plakobranchus ocellatus TaxID=259542 RepID=A0AAV3YC04_9GAST|nr:hypothetical protein PoB_000653300 [Plakobranchus ocellatus]
MERKGRDQRESSDGQKQRVKRKKIRLLTRSDSKRESRNQLRNPNIGQVGKMRYRDLLHGMRSSTWRHSKVAVHDRLPSNVNLMRCGMKDASTVPKQTDFRELSQLLQSNSKSGQLYVAIQRSVIRSHYSNM